MAQQRDNIDGGLGETSLPDNMPSKLKVCTSCMKTQPASGQFCVYCGAKELTVIQTAAQESYLHQTVAGRFKIVDFIDRGGMGEVYLGLNESIGQKVAIKFLYKKFAVDERLVMRFLNEAKSYCRVSHPNAVTLLEYGQHDDGALYIITEFIEGKSLSKTLKDTGPFEMERVISVGKQICEVLTAAHTSQVIHRDLKPDNIMLTPSSGGRFHVKVLDFGIAKIVDDDAQMTETGAIFGSPEFMSPEQAKGEEAGPRSDIYALGLILFYMATGRLPFKGKNKFAVLHAHINTPARVPSKVAPYMDILPAFDQIVGLCLDKDPAKRFKDANALYNALEHLRANHDLRSPTQHELRAEGLTSPEDASSDSSEPPQADTKLLGFADTEPPPEARIGAQFQTRPDPADDWTLGNSSLAESVDTEPPEDDFDLYAKPPSTLKRVIVALCIIGGLAAAMGWVFTRQAQPPLEPPSTASELTEVPDVRDVLVTSQVLAMLTTAQDSLQQGGIDDARRQLEASRLWLDDDALPPKAAALRNQLEAKLTKLTQAEEDVVESIQRGRCQDALARASSIQVDSQLLAAKLRERASECIRKRSVPVKGPSVRPKRVLPPKPAAPQVPLKSSGPRPPAQDKTPVKQVPDGMALPPKQID